MNFQTCFPPTPLDPPPEIGCPFCTINLGLVFVGPLNNRIHCNGVDSLNWSVFWTFINEFSFACLSLCCNR